MTDHIPADPHWQRALDWILREHEASLDDAAHVELAAWLKADPAHLKAYREASRVWLIAGLVPPQSGQL